MVRRVDGINDVFVHLRKSAVSVVLALNLAFFFVLPFFGSRDGGQSE